jgi:hypothetical protein
MRMGRGAPAGVPLVTAADVVQHVGQSQRLAALHVLAPAALRPDFGGGRDEQLGGRVGGDDGSDVSPVEHRAVAASGEVPLQRQERGAYLRMGGGLARSLADLGRADGFRVDRGGVESAGGGGGEVLVEGIAASLEHGDSHPSIKRARVEVREVLKRGHAGCDGALAGGGGPVHGDDEGCHGGRRREPGAPAT